MLYHLELSSNKNLVLSIPFDQIPIFQLDVIRLGSCKLEPQLPNYLQTQKNLSDLDISNSGILNSIPNWFWNSSTHLTVVNLAKNQICGPIANYSSKGSFAALNLSWNQFEGPIPFFSSELLISDSSNNKFSSLNSLCDVTNDALLSFLYISHNQLAGELPDYWSRFKKVTILNLSHKKLSGHKFLILLETYISVSLTHYIWVIRILLENCLHP